MILYALGIGETDLRYTFEVRNEGKSQKQQQSQQSSDWAGREA